MLKWFFLTATIVLLDKNKKVAILKVSISYCCYTKSFLWIDSLFWNGLKVVFCMGYVNHFSAIYRKKQQKFYIDKNRIGKKNHK